MDPKIVLVPSAPEFAEVGFDWRTQQSSQKHNPLKEMTIEDVRKQYSSEGHDLKDLFSHSSFRWIAVVENVPVGQVNLKNVNSMMMYAEIGYGVGEKFQGRGYGTEIVKQWVAKIFKETNLRKLIAYVHDKNLPSNRLLSKIGFLKEGLLREHYIINGKPENEVLYGLLRNEFHK